MTGTRALARPLTDDEAWSAVAAAGRGDQAAFDLWYRDTYRPVRTHVRAMLSDREMAEDVVSEVYLRAWSGAAHIRRAAGNPISWLFKVGHHLAVNATRRAEFRYTRPTGEFRDAVEDAVATGRVVIGSVSAYEPEPLAVDADRIRFLADRLDDLLDRIPSEKQRRILRVRFIDGKTVADAADEMGLPGTAARTLQARATRTAARIAYRDGLADALKSAA